MAFKAKQTYKGRPLVRRNNEIYYGDMSEAYVVFMQILTTRKENGDDLPDKVTVMLLSSDTSLPPMERIVRQSVKNGLYNALDFASILLDKSLAAK